MSKSEVKLPPAALTALAASGPTHPLIVRCAREVVIRRMFKVVTRYRGPIKVEGVEPLPLRRRLADFSSLNAITACLIPVEIMSRPVVRFAR